ncbi:MAG: BspA family leucine-rich repeat surface protein [Lachnospiraceae bacterium]|nr:BspA family leucine-rich repeat surface protein [Lachnospiraceae bacterium]
MKSVKKRLAILLSIAMVMCSTLPSLASKSDVLDETAESKVTEELCEDLGQNAAEDILDIKTLSETEEELEEKLAELEEDQEEKIDEEPEEDQEEKTIEEIEEEQEENTEIEIENDLDEKEIENNEEIAEGSETEKTVEETDETSEIDDTSKSEEIEETTEISEAEETKNNDNETTTEETSSENKESLDEDIVKVEDENVIVSEENLLGASTPWCYWYVDETDPENVTIHYSSTEPANYSSYPSGKKGSVSGTMALPNPSSATVKQSIKTAVFDNVINTSVYSGWFNSYSNLTTIINLSYLNASNVTSMKNMFKSCTSLTSIDFPAINAENVTNLSYMFSGCTSLVSVNLSQVTFDKVEDMSYMFKDCTALTTVNLSGVLSNSVTNINTSYMFQNCTSLTSIDVNSMNLSNVSNMSNMFEGCTALESLDFSATSIAAVNRISYMFKNCINLKSLNLSSFNTSNVTYKTNTFENCNALISLNLSQSFASIINGLKLTGNWKKTTSDTIYEYTSNKTTIPAEAAEYERAFKITFDTKGGNAITPVFKTYNSNLDLPNAVRPGFTFEAWYNESELSTPVASPITVTQDRTVYAKWSGGEGAQLIYWGIGKSSNTSSGKVRRLYIASSESGVSIYSTEFRGSFANTADFNSAEEVPWHLYRSEINYFSVSSSQTYPLIFKSMAYWFKDMTKLIYASGLQQLTRYNDMLENISYAFEGCTNIKYAGFYVTNNLKNMECAFNNCSSIKYVNTLKRSGVASDSINVQLESGGFKDAFSGCTSLRRLNLRFLDFSSYTGDVFSCMGLSNLVRIRIKDSGNIFSRIGLSGEWWEYDSGNKYTSSNMPNNVRQIRKYETFSNTIYWYVQGNEVHLSSSKPSNANYKEGHYFNGDEPNVYGMLPLDEPDDSRIVLDNNIVLRNDAGSSFFCNLASAREIVNMNKLNTSAVTDMESMFSDMALTSVDLSSLDTRNVEIMNSMFFACENLSSLDLSNFNTSKVLDMGYMFYGCTSLQSLVLTSFDTSKVQTMDGMFGDCSSITSIDISSFSSAGLEDDGNGYNDTSIDSMFYACSSLRTIYASDSFDITFDSSYTYVSGDDIFTDCVQLVGGNGTRYNENHVGAEYARIDAAGTPGYFTRGTGTPPTPVKVLTSITVNTAPTKVKYKVGESFDPTGLKINLNYGIGASEVVTYNNSTSNLFSFNPSLVDTFSTAGSSIAVEITYSGKTCTQYVDVIEPQTISVKTAPSKVKYLVGEWFDPTGLELELTYSDNITKETILYLGNEFDISFDPSRVLAISDDHITITYNFNGNDYSCNLSINVLELSSIAVKVPPTTLKYAKRSTFNPIGLSIELTYSDNVTKETVTYAGNEAYFTFNPSLGQSLNTVGSSIPVTITYGGKSCVQNIEVVELSSIEIDTPPSKVVYDVGERFDLTGLKLKLIYSDSSNQVVTYSSSNSSSFSFTPNTAYGLTSADTTITINYAGKSCTQNLTLRDLSSIVINTNPTRVNYATGQSLNPNGLTLTLNWTYYTVSGTTTDSNNVAYNSTTQSKFEFNPSGALMSSGNITVTYDRKTGANRQPSFAVTVRTVASISVIDRPNKTTYRSGEKFAPAGLSINVEYEDGTDTVVSYSSENARDFSFNPSPSLSLNTGHSSVTITYGGKSTNFAISVISNSYSGGGTSSSGSGSSRGGGGSGGGGNSVPPAGYIQYNNQPSTTQTSTNKQILAVMNSKTSTWAVDPTSGKWKLNAVDMNGQALSASNGFYLLTNTVTAIVNNVPVQVEVNNTYYFDAQGNMVTGWVQTADNKWYFFDTAKTADEGRMVIGWKVVDGAWRYFNADGSMMVNGVTPGGFIIGADGKWIA